MAEILEAAPAGLICKTSRQHPTCLEDQAGTRLDGVLPQLAISTNNKAKHVR